MATEQTPPRPSFAETSVPLGGPSGEGVKAGGSPGKDSPRQAPPADTPRRRPSARGLEAKLRDFFAGVSLAIMATGDEHCAMIVADRAEALAAAYTRLAEANPKVKAILERLTSTGAYGEAIAVTLATAVPIALHHAPESVRVKLAMFPLGPVAAEPIVPPPPNGNGNGHPQN